MTLEHLNDQEIVRRKKLQELKENHQDPFLIEKIENITSLRTIVGNFQFSTKEQLEEVNEIFTCCGRVLLIRQTFFVISEEHVQLQAYINIKNSPEELTNYFKKYLDIGDYVSIKGSVFLTQKNELTLRVKELKIISKCLKPLPEKHLGIKNKELLVRERVASLIIDKELFRTFVTRSQIIFEIRSFLFEKEYLEFETPTLQHIPGGAIAKPFVTHYKALNESFYLRIAPELALKKIITSGYTKIFEIGKSFRNEGIDATHNPEFTSIEIYTAYFGMEECISLTENIFHHICKKFFLKTITWNNHEINISAPFEKKSISELLKEKIGIDFYKDNVSIEQALKIASEHSISLLEHEITIGHIMHKLFDKLIEEQLIQPTFIYGYHKDISPLSKSDPKNPNFTLRFELFIGGKEFANGFAELNDPIDQLQRFEAQIKEKDLGNDEVSEIDYEYIKNIEYGLPPTGGVGIGLDRLIMLFTNKSSIKDVVFFPQIKK